MKGCPAIANAASTLHQEWKGKVHHLPVNIYSLSRNTKLDMPIDMVSEYGRTPDLLRTSRKVSFQSKSCKLAISNSISLWTIDTHSTIRSWLDHLSHNLRPSIGHFKSILDFASFKKNTVQPGFTLHSQRLTQTPWLFNLYLCWTMIGWLQLETYPFLIFMRHDPDRRDGSEVWLPGIVYNAYQLKSLLPRRVEQIKWTSGPM